MKNQYLAKFYFEKIPEFLKLRAKLALENYFDACLSHNMEPVQTENFLQKAAYVLAISDFAADTANRFPNLVNQLFNSADIELNFNSKSYSMLFDLAVEQRDLLMQQLRLMRRKQLFRIIWQDLNQLSDVWQLMSDWSDFADSCIHYCLNWLDTHYQKKYGAPRNQDGQVQKLAVIAVGKLGGQELNWSSDIDLMFAYEAEGETDHGIAYAKYFTRQAQDLIQLLNQVTPEGFVFRVDLRLRPNGATGALVSSLSSLANYYHESARDWERYALLRARILTGNLATQKKLSKIFDNFVYSNVIDYTTLEPLRLLQKKIDQDNKSKNTSDDIKRGWGGIREIEFIIQTRQLIAGGEHWSLRTPSLKKAIKVIGEEQLIDPQKLEHLVSAYVFLRRVEHMIQAMQDRQSHSLPHEQLTQRRLAVACGYSDWSAFLEALNHERERVSKYYQDLLRKPSFQSYEEQKAFHQNARLLWRQREKKDLATLNDMGYENAENVYQELKRLREGLNISTKNEEQMNQLIPIVLLTIAHETDNPDETWLRVMKIIKEIAKRSVFLTLFLENPKALSQLIRLCSTGVWITELLVNYPQLLGQLIDTKRLYAPLDLRSLSQACRNLLVIHTNEPIDNQLDALARFKLVHLFRIAAMDVTGVLPMMRVSDYLTNLATVILTELTELAMTALYPDNCPYSLAELRRAFAVIGFGKLGGIELGYGSDLDLIFLYDAIVKLKASDFNPELFYTQVVRRITAMLQTPTKNGKLYPVDLRLRPQGESGLLVNTLAAFQDYQLNSAWTWEHQALVRARSIVASEHLAIRFEQMRQKVLTQARDIEQLRQDVCAMREKMRQTKLAGPEDDFDLKQGLGGIIDIEFLVQFFALAYANQYPELIDYTDNIRILERLVYTGVMPVQETQSLSDAYRAYRSYLHRLDLLQQPAIVPESYFKSYRELVVELWHKYL